MATTERFQRIRRVLNRRQVDLTVLLEKVHKPHNFNAILRSCDAAGVFEAHAVLLGEGAGLRDLTSQGTSKWVRVRTHDSIDGATAELLSRGFRLVAAHLEDPATDHRELDMTRPTALVFGTELHGVSRDTLDRIDERVCIPMAGMGASLNVSVAAALLLFEARRQRERAGMYARRQLDDATYRKLLFEWSHPRVAEYCRRHGHDYPPLDDEGEILKDPRRTTRDLRP